MKRSDSVPTKFSCQRCTSSAPGARALTTIALPLVSALAAGGAGGGGGEGGGGPSPPPGAAAPGAVLVPVVKLWDARVQPGYVTVADGAADVRVALVEPPAGAAA